MAAQEFRLKDVAALPAAPGDKQEVEVEGIDGGKVLLVNAGGKVQAIGSKCTHYGAPLIKGVLTTTGRLTCPWHGGKFTALARCSSALLLILCRS
jgi:nitrite reductase/ring-hydroxylating ferredoxin subunit